MPRVPSISPATGNPTSSSYIHTTACNFVDSTGRTLLLRGVNLSGSSKAPVGKQSYVLEDFWEDAEAGVENFIGQPLNIDDGSADVHLARLRGWGFNMLRFPVTWEALEHEGPGKYDYDFMDYTIRVLKKCKEYGFRVYMDPHQDIWSRFSGGSGAPFWTLPACGIDPRNLTATQSAIIHCEYPLPHIADPASLPAMIWSTNYGRLLSQTVFTLFFAGRDFAPHCIIDGQNIQDYLQSHYIEACGVLADRIRLAGDLLDECVIGWDSLNEPFEGLCGWDDLSSNPLKQGSTLKKGTHPTPAQSLRLGMGQAQTVENWTFGALGPSRDGSVTIDPKGVKVWAAPESESAEGVNARWGWRRDAGRWKLGTCVWAQHGVWDVETGFVLREDYFRFSPTTGEPVDFIVDYWKPHFVAFARRIRRAHPEAILFVQPPVFAPPPEMGVGEGMGEEEEEGVLKGRCAYSAHYYDGLTLVTRHWNWFNADALGLLRGRYSNTLQAVKIGEGAIRRSLQEQLGMLKADAEILGPYPTIIGEIGIPFDMDGKRAYGWTDGGKYKGDYSRQEKALDASLNGADGENALNWTVWTYCTDHTHDWSDGWNMEDLSLWSADDLREREADDAGSLTSQLGDDDEGLYDGHGDSRAMLLQTKNASTKDKDKDLKDTSIVTVAAAAASSLSLATLGSIDRTAALGAYPHPSAADGTKLQPTRAPRRMPTLDDWRTDPYGFLTNGARAFRAFCRPWPHKVVGVPVDMRFEIGKAYFKLVVRVAAEDAPLSTASAAEGEGEGEEREEKGKLATEIYVPLVHYAVERLVRGGCGSVEGGVVKEGSEAEMKLEGLMDPGHRRSGSAEEQQQQRVSGRSSAVGSRWASSVDLPAMMSASMESSGSTSTAATTSSSTAAGTGTGVDQVDVAVKVSAGRWEVEGQMLRWWYDVPEEGEPPREYTIEIKRRVGVIKVSGKEHKEERSLCEKFCDEHAGCRVM
ncbi:hypothetical protein D9615_002083 [Tricholomella constricta]|uniref:Glycoside hydrolase family 5 protein n=1 Tax=Tricholomella constricta TaxID=117010 RepID=A0A8H5MA23_9AGAR|nr:hypothetical protein D9615_002083 [Tricholomella constricta]